LLAAETQEMRRRILLSVCETAGEISFRAVTPSDIKQGKLRREATPAAAHNYVRMMRVLFAFAVDHNWIEINPAAQVKTVEPETEGHHTWTVDEVLQYQEHHPLGTQARLALDILLFTGFRRGDAVVFGKQHVRDGIVHIRTAKTKTEVIFPLLRPLAQSIAKTKTGDLAFLCTLKGQPWAKESFGMWFAEQCAAAGVPGRAHGLRKAGATFAAENGANAMQLCAMYGWTDERMARKYVERASRIRLAEQAANKLSPHLKSGAGARAKR
jgi:integrase